MTNGDGNEGSDAGNTLPDSKVLEAAFDPLPLDVIAKVFPLIKDPERNLSHWKYLAGKASQNGLDSARKKAGKGKAQSTFNPYFVGCWVITIKDGLAPDFVNRKLSSNLPKRSDDFKDETFV